MSATTYPVTGMTCDHCVQAVTSELSRLGGVSGVAVNLVPGGVSLVTVTSNGPLPETEVSDALDEAGGYVIAAS
jgi:copper chaperone CopZ